MHYSRIQNVTPADSRDVCQNDLRARAAARRGRARRGPSRGLGLYCLKYLTGGPPVLSTRCIHPSFILSFPLPTSVFMLPSPIGIANPIHGAPKCSLNFCTPVSVCRILGRQHGATNAGNTYCFVVSLGLGPRDRSLRRLAARAPF